MRRLALVACLAWICSAGTSTPSGQEQLFAFHSAFWVNLHHFLHALTRKGAPVERPLPPTATADEQDRWRRALDHYRLGPATRSLLFDANLVRLKHQLIAAAGDSLAASPVSDPERAVLEAAAPVYRRYWWPARDEANQRFIGMLQPLLAQHGRAIATRLARTYDASWPPTPIRVDIVGDAGPPGSAYTTNDPTHITIGADDPRHRGYAALELVFHEASHGWDALLMNDVAAAGARLGVQPPRDLWHALLFFNAGAITTTVLEAAGVRGYEAYADAQGLFARPFRGWREPIARHWPAVVAGTVSRPDAISRIVGELP